MFLYLFYFFAVSIISLNSASAQQQIDEWAAYTSTKKLNHLLVHQNRVWSASSGGVLCFDLSTQTYTRFTRLNGLAGNKVLSVVADTRGHLWFGTDQNGLSRFRPETETFDPPFKDFENHKIQALAAIEDRIFVGMDRGVSAFLIDKQEVKETYSILGHLTKDTEVTALAVFAGKLWAGTVEGVAWADLSLPNLQDPDSWNSTTAVGRVRDMVVFSDTLFIAGHFGVSRFDADEEDFSLELITSNLRGLGLFGGTVVAATDKGAFFQRSGVEKWEVLQGVPDIEYIRALSRVDTTLWVATLEGLQVVGAEPPPPLREPTGNQFYDLTVTNGDELWVASVPSDQVSPRHGIYRFDGEGWTVYDQTSGLPSDIAVALQSDREGNLWVGTWGRGIGVRDTSGTWHHLTFSNSVLAPLAGSRSFVVISDIVRDANDLLWIANVQTGVVVMDGYPPDQQLLYDQDAIGLPAGRDIKRIAIAADGLKWISTPRDGFILFDDGGTPFEKGDEFARVISTTDPDSSILLTSDRASDIAVNGNQVWVGTDNGLNVMRYNYTRSTQSFEILKWRVYNTDNGLPSGVINALETDSQGNVWVGTDLGLTQIGADGEIAITLTTANSGLINNRVKSLFFDDRKGELWIGTLDGLSRLQVNPVYNGASFQARVYPNPFLLGTRGATLTFVDLPLGASLRIFALDGSLVQKIEGEPGRGTISWDGFNQSRFSLVGSGLYFFIAEDEAGNRVKGKFAVVKTR